VREYSEERSVLAALAERMSERPVLVTFNGKSFDWPLLETRYRMARTIPPPAPRAHLDFLHPARNLWRLRLGSVRLSQLERHVLGWDRGADIASELIPRIYVDFVRGGRAEPLVPVFLHNQMDLRGLAGLSGRILHSSATGREPVRMAWNCSASPAFANDVARQSVRGNCTNSRSPPSCRREPIVLPAPHWHVSPSVTETSHARTNSGKVHWATLARATKPTNSWQFTMNTKLANQNVRWRSPSSVVRTRQGRSRRPNIAGSRHGSSTGCCVSNAEQAGRCSTRVTHSHTSVASRLVSAEVYRCRLLLSTLLSYRSGFCNLASGQLVPLPIRAVTAQPSPKRIG